MKILITGATGFVGQNLIPKLQKETYTTKILLMVRDIHKAQQLYGVTTNLCYAPADDWNSLLQFAPDIVFHLAAYSTSANEECVIDMLLDSNIKYGVHLLHHLSSCGSLRLFVNIGTFAEYRFSVAHKDSAYLYAATKTAYRAFLDYYSDLYKFKYITAVPYSVYGGKPTIKRLMDYMEESLNAVDAVGMTSGEQVLDFIHVDDVSDFFIDIINHVEAYCQLPNTSEIHLGTGHGTSIRELAALMEDVTKKKCNIQWGARPYRERDVMYAVAPLSFNYGKTNWKSRISLKEGVRMFIESKNHA